MAQAIELAQRDGVAALDALDSVARDHGARLGALARERAATTGETASERAASAGTASTDSVLDVLAEGGYEPRACEAAITLVNCPFHRLAQDHTALVCRMNLSLICGLVEAAGAGLSAALEPGEHRCCVVLKAT
jgi:predicted ArsR family transcriptional regulator